MKEKWKKERMSDWKKTRKEVNEEKCVWKIRLEESEWRRQLQSVQKRKGKTKQWNERSGLEEQNKIKYISKAKNEVTENIHINNLP